MTQHNDYECPKCGEWIALTHAKSFACPWCLEALEVNADADFRDGVWHDLTRLIARKPL